MNRKLRCRPSHTPCIAPVAAEVLELRTLLSAAGSAAHAAAHHATTQTHAVESHASNAPVIASHPFHITQNAEIQIGNGDPFLVRVNFSISSIKSVDGAKVTAHASGSSPVDGGRVTIKALFTGTVQNVGSKDQITDVDITPTGGSLVLKISEGGRHFSATALPNGTHSGAELFGTKFNDFHATDLFPANSIPLVRNEAITFELSTT